MNHTSCYPGLLEERWTLSVFWMRGHARVSLTGGSTRCLPLALGCYPRLEDSISSSPFTTGSVYATPEIPYEDATPRTSSSKGQGDKSGHGDAHVLKPRRQIVSFPEKIAQHKDAHQPKIELFESFKEVVGGGRGNQGQHRKCQNAPAPLAQGQQTLITRKHDAKLPRMGLDVVGRTGGGCLAGAFARLSVEGLTISSLGNRYGRG
jgi:hypothetical protein